MNPSNSSEKGFYAKITLWEYVRRHKVDYLLLPILIPVAICLLVFWQTHNPGVWVMALLGVLFLYLNALATLATGVRELNGSGKSMNYKKLFSRKWKTLDMNTVSHACFFLGSQARGQLAPAVRFYTSERKYIQLEFLLPEEAIYELLSRLHDLGKPVLLWEEEKNIEETEHYKSR